MRLPSAPVVPLTSPGSYLPSVDRVARIWEKLAEPEARLVIGHLDADTDAGIRRRGVRAHGTEQHGAFTFEALTDLDAQTSNISLGPTDLTGGVPSLLLPGLRLLSEFRHPN